MRSESRRQEVAEGERVKEKKAIRKCGNTAVQQYSSTAVQQYNSTTIERQGKEQRAGENWMESVTTERT
jgi:hypothetical protein